MKTTKKSKKRSLAEFEKLKVVLKQLADTAEEMNKLFLEELARHYDEYQKIETVVKQHRKITRLWREASEAKNMREIKRKSKRIEQIETQMNKQMPKLTDWMQKCLDVITSKKLPEYIS